MMPARKKAGRATPSWRRLIADALDWEQGHASLDAAAREVPRELRGRRPVGSPHSVWDLLDHIRRTQADLLDFMTNEHYAAPSWPKDYWPAPAAVPSAHAWAKCLAQIRADREELKRLALSESTDLTAEIPWGDGQTYLRCILLVIDHTSYHVGQMVMVRRLIGAWKGG
jgi:uncharacterized damage-inducible protein DinB